MPSVAETARLLSRFADLVSLMAVLPVLSEVKFGGLIRAQEQAKKAREDTKKNDKDKAVEAAVKPTGESPDEQAAIPPAWAFLLLLLAELCSSPGVFNPRDKMVTRAFGEVARVHKKPPSGFANVVKTVEKLLGHEDVYALVHLCAVVAGLGGLLLTTGLGLHKLGTFGSGPNNLGFFDLAKRSLKQFLRAIHVPRAWFLVALVGMMAIGNWSALMKLAERTVVKELMRNSADLLRLLAFTGSVMTSKSAGPMPAWASMQVLATIARAAHYVVYNRVSVPALFAAGASASARGALIVKAWSLLILIPSTLTSKKFMLIVLLLAVPCVVLALDGPIALQMAPFLDAGIQRIALVVTILGIFMVFLGGFPTMLAVLVMLQGLSRIHRLEAVKF